MAPAVILNRESRINVILKCVELIGSIIVFFLLILSSPQFFDDNGGLSTSKSAANDRSTTKKDIVDDNLNFMFYPIVLSAFMVLVVLPLLVAAAGYARSMPYVDSVLSIVSAILWAAAVFVILRGYDQFPMDREDFAKCSNPRQVWYGTSILAMILACVHSADGGSTSVLILVRRQMRNDVDRRDDSSMLSKS